MGVDSELKQSDDREVDLCSHTGSQKSGSSISCQGTDKEEKYTVCRVCQCLESDRRGDAALGFLHISAPFPEILETNGNDEKNSTEPFEEDVKGDQKDGRKPGFVELVSPDGEIFICSTDVEAGSCYQQDALIKLGCSCKGDLALAHYACALKWFISHGSTICEICGSVATNVRAEDVKKVMASLKDYESLRERTATGEFTYVRAHSTVDVDPDALAAIRRQRLSEIYLWFNPHSNSTTVIQGVSVMDQSSIIPQENTAASESVTAKWAVEGTGILVATGLLTVTLAWLIAPRVGKKTAKNGLHILLGGVCALTVVIFLRFIVLSRIKYGPARYWAILFVFWFLVFGIWASRTHGAHTS